jgi:hypothetical protein
MKVYELIEKLLQCPESLNKDVVMPGYFLDESTNEIWIDYAHPDDVTGFETAKDGRVILLD